MSATDVKSIFIKVIIYAVLIIWGITTIFPFVWVLNNSFKKTNEILETSFELVTKPTYEHYDSIFHDESRPIVQAYINSIVISTTVCLVVILISALFSFAMTRYRFKWSTTLFSLIVAAQMIPAFSTIIPNYKTLMALGLRNNIFSVILIQIASNLAFATLILISYMRTLPLDLEEAAYLEGCNVFQILQKVIFPITRPAFATVAIFAFIWSYNDLFSQIFFLRDKRKGYTINRLLNEIASKEGTDYGAMAASVVLIVIPVMVIYMMLQKNIIKGLTAGAIKG